MKKGILFKLFFLFIFLSLTLNIFPQQRRSQLSPEENFRIVLHSISGTDLYNYVKHITDDKYKGRLSGTKEYQEVAEWLADWFKDSGVKPHGDNNTYFQYFDIPYILVKKNCFVSLDIPVKNDTIQKYYKYEDDFMPGSTSGSGKVKAEVVYVGYGVTAPELNYDDYKNVDVKGKIVLMEREVPVEPDKNPELFKKWRPYSFHQYKLENAVKHGAVGMLYNYGPIANPNNAYNAHFIYSHVGNTVVKDIFKGTGKSHREVVEKIAKELQPQSFYTGKIATIQNTTEYHPDGKAPTVIGYVEGSDPQLKNEFIVISAHLDHVGQCYETVPGANDNASGVASMMGAAKALANPAIHLKRSVMFIAFAGEEDGVVGSKYYIKNPEVPLENTVCVMNLDGVGCGNRIWCLSGKNFPAFWSYINDANEKYVHGIVVPTEFSNLARPRLDAARFLWAGVSTVSFNVSGAKSFYHIPKDDISTITPEIMEQMSRILFLSAYEMANADSVNFRSK